jgi:predicted DNA-binding ribbon-helix-helix protein
MPRSRSSLRSVVQDDGGERLSRGFKRSLIIGGRNTSVNLEDAFWKALKEIADVRSMTGTALVEGIDSARRHDNLSSAIRLFVLNYYRRKKGASNRAARRRPARNYQAQAPEELLARQS